MTYTTSQPSADFAQRLSTIRRHLIGLTAALDALERDMQARQEPQPDGERAAQRAREEIFLTGPQNVKETMDYDLMSVMMKKKQ